MEYKIEGVNIHKQLVCDDPRLNYTFIKQEELDDEQRGTRLPEFLDKELIDYDIIIEKEEDTDDHTVGIGKLSKTVPASYCSIKTVEEGTEWFATKHPEYPDQLSEILARYTWGSKKENEEQTQVKKRSRKKKGEPEFKVKKGKFEVCFD
tara:strand:- start:1125 stop:1574 length:450 start_codon:yes stop_codon:yes gene_type:complete